MIDVPDLPGPIVTVDDEEVFLELLMYCHGRSELSNELLTFRSGPECMSYLDQVKGDDGLTPCLLLVDVNMPGMSGFEVVRSIRSRMTFRRELRIAMLTSSASPTDADTAIEAGADAVYEKPMRILSLKFVGGYRGNSQPQGSTLPTGQR